jgi:hypothetical protein
MSREIVAAGDAEMDILETVTDPSVILVDREYFHIMKFKDAFFNVLNDRMPGAIARAGGVKAYKDAYSKQYAKEHPESIRANNAKHNAKNLLPLKCENCGDMSSKKCMKRHQKTKRCQAASKTPPTTVINNITAQTVHIYN